MLVSFKLHNWLSYRDEVAFSMVASKERQHRDRVPRVKKFNMGILPVATIYGGNASGKSNFIKALKFAQQAVTRHSLPNSKISSNNFLLDKKGYELPTKFSFELLINEVIYDFSFTYYDRKILSEKLIRITSTSEEVLYKRTEYQKYSFSKKIRDLERVKHVSLGTHDNQLFLNNSISQKIVQFAPVFDWFKNNLILILPTSMYAGDAFFSEDKTVFNQINSILPGFDTGISKIDIEQTSLKNRPDLTFYAGLLDKEEDDEAMIKVPLPRSFGTRVCRKDGQNFAMELKTFHKSMDGTEIAFHNNQESDGTVRLLNLLPAFVRLGHESFTVVIDELDRSLHPLLSRTLLDTYLSKCSFDTRAQLIFTTHDVSLMDQKDLLRRDEIWVVEKDEYGGSKMYSFSEFDDLRHDKDIQKMYMLGQLGGIPHLL